MTQQQTKYLTIFGVALLFLIGLSVFSWGSSNNYSRAEEAITRRDVQYPIIHEFKKTIQEVRKLYHQCINGKVPLESCITEQCPVPPFGVDARPSFHPQTLVGNNCEPWMRRDVVLLLNKLVQPHFTVLEWSSGSSTTWLLPRVSKLISVENNAEWAVLVQRKIEAMGMKHKSQFHVITGTEEGPQWAKSSTGQYFVDYVGVPIPMDMHAKFDMIIVDGRARAACLQRAISLLKPEGGLLVLDNSERSEYRKESVPRYWPRFVSHTSRPTETTVWMSALPH